MKFFPSAKVILFMHYSYLALNLERTALQLGVNTTLCHQTGMLALYKKRCNSSYGTHL